MNVIADRCRSLFVSSRDGHQLATLAQFLNISPEDVQSIPNNPRLSYRHFTIPKRNGRRRRIVAPSDPLKKLQRQLLSSYLAAQEVHWTAMAFRRGYSTASHARHHLGQAVVLTVDLADFFTATSANRVRRWFRKLDWQGRALDVLMRICVYRASLPQGAPTSPALSNLVNLPLDRRLSELAAHSGGRYSRYCDDIAFSWGSDIEPAVFRPQVEDCLQRFGYQVQHGKGWRKQRAADRPELTGLVIHGHRLRLPDSILRRVRHLKSSWRRKTKREKEQLAGYEGLWKSLR